MFHKSNLIKQFNFYREIIFSIEKYRNIVTVKTVAFHKELFLLKVLKARKRSWY